MTKTHGRTSRTTIRSPSWPSGRSSTASTSQTASAARGTHAGTAGASSTGTTTNIVTARSACTPSEVQRGALPRLANVARRLSRHGLSRIRSACRTVGRRRGRPRSGSTSVSRRSRRSTTLNKGTYAGSPTRRRVSAIATHWEPRCAHFAVPHRKRGTFKASFATSQSRCSRTFATRCSSEFVSKNWTSIALV